MLIGLDFASYEFWDIIRVELIVVELSWMFLRHEECLVVLAVVVDISEEGTDEKTIETAA